MKSNVAAMLTLLGLTLFVLNASAEIERVSMFEHREVSKQLSQMLANSQLKCSDGKSASNLSNLDNFHSIGADKAQGVFKLNSSCCSRDIYASSEMVIVASPDRSQAQSIEIKYEELKNGQWVVSNQVTCQ